MQSASQRVAIAMDKQRREDKKKNKEECDVLERHFGFTLEDAQEKMLDLTPREVQVIELLASGKKGRLIAEELGIAPKTLVIHRANIMRKFRVQTTIQIVNVYHLVAVVAAI
jgi:DNA-binding CsgD family transcriptional regulator